MEKKFDVIVVGELNVDLILNRIDSFPQIGKEILAKDMILTLGSSSAIFASNLSSLGAKVSFIGKIGKDSFGEVVLKSLRSKGVDTSLIISKENLNTGATIVMNYDEDRAMVTHMGAMADLTIEDITTEKLSQAKHLHFSSFFLQKGIRKDVGKLFKKAKDAGLTTSFDTQWDPEETWELDFKEILPYVDVFLPNEKELMRLTRKNDLDSALAALNEDANVIMVKRGNKGSLSYFKGKSLQQEPFLNKDVVDAIGAGDSFNAGFVFKYIQKKLLEECQRFGNLTGAVNTTAAGGTTAFKDYKTVMEIAKNKFNYAE